MKLFFQLLLLAALAGCGAKSSAPPAGKPTRHELPLPEIPAMLVDDSSRLDYLSAHYWDGFDFKDTTWIADTAALEQAFADCTKLERASVPVGAGKVGKEAFNGRVQVTVRGKKPVLHPKGWAAKWNRSAVRTEWEKDRG